ncbi:MAG TPA: indole-3-glycerol phosphate synthase TrpC [Gemmatimonadales bacterium]|nr:indole-3-glycerol phosphate synthase TrpC [Gemmatimonadales bacterium]
MPVLAQILAETRTRVAQLQPQAAELARLARQAPQAKPFLDQPGKQVGVIAEVKRRSPSQGSIRPDLDSVAVATSYQRGGAEAVSVLTEERHFGGSIDDLRRVAGAVSVPVLRKDFIIDEAQILEARSAGASAVLLIVRILDGERLRALAAAVREWGMTPLIEIHDAVELEAALDALPGVLGINARDLNTLEMNTDNAIAVMSAIPPNVVLVAESGVQRRDDVERLAAAGADFVLVGTSVARQDDHEQAVRALTGVRRVPR